PRELRVCHPLRNEQCGEDQPGDDVLRHPTPLVRSDRVDPRGEGPERTTWARALVRARTHRILPSLSTTVGNESGRRYSRAQAPATESVGGRLRRWPARAYRA